MDAALPVPVPHSPAPHRVTQEPLWKSNVILSAAFASANTRNENVDQPMAIVSYDRHSKVGKWVVCCRPKL